MAFSLSPLSLSRARGRNGGLFVLIVLFKLFVLVVLIKLLVLLDFFGGAAFRAVVAHEVRTESIERNNLVRITLKNRRTRHSAHDAGIFALGDGHSAGGLDRSEAFGAIIAHAGHDNSDAGKSKFLRDGMKYDIG